MTNHKKIIYIANDHAGYELKTKIVSQLKQLGYEIHDLGSYDDSSVDYPDYAQKLSLEIREHIDSARGILVCGTGTGMAIGANRYPWIRATVYDNRPEILKLAVEKNHINVLCYGARFFDSTHLEASLDIFLTTQNSGDRHERRVLKLGKPCF